MKTKLALLAFAMAGLIGFTFCFGYHAGYLEGSFKRINGTEGYRVARVTPGLSGRWVLMEGWIMGDWETKEEAEKALSYLKSLESK